MNLPCISLFLPSLRPSLEAKDHHQAKEVLLSPSRPERKIRSIILLSEKPRHTVSYLYLPSASRLTLDPNCINQLNLQALRWRLDVHPSYHSSRMDNNFSSLRRTSTFHNIRRPGQILKPKGSFVRLHRNRCSSSESKPVSSCVPGPSHFIFITSSVLEEKDPSATKLFIHKQRR